MDIKAPQQSQETINALNAQHLEGIDKSLIEINKKLDDKYATKEELKIVADKADFNQRIVYGFIGMIVVAVMGTLIASVIIPKTVTRQVQPSIIQTSN